MTDKKFQKIAKALADPRRFEIYQVIAECHGDICCGDILAKFPIKHATVSHHLKELAEADLIEVHPEGQFRYWSTKPETLLEYIDSLRTRTRISESTQNKKHKH